MSPIDEHSFCCWGRSGSEPVTYPTYARSVSLNNWRRFDGVSPPTHRQTHKAYKRPLFHDCTVQVTPGSKIRPPSVTASPLPQLGQLQTLWHLQNFHFLWLQSRVRMMTTLTKKLEIHDRLCGLVVRVPGYWTEMYCVSCEVRTEFIYVM
jgi:hypothetical protein